MILKSTEKYSQTELCQHTCILLRSAKELTDVNSAKKEKNPVNNE